MTTNLASYAAKLLQHESRERHSLPDGWCEDLALFEKIIHDFPGAPVRFTLRNFNDPTRISHVEILIEGLSRLNRAYYNGANIVAIFPEIAPWLKNHERAGCVPIREFVANGTEIASCLKREFFIIHQFGSGDPDQAEFKDFGPFVPIA
jgi:hypothetical protein